MVETSPPPSERCEYCDKDGDPCLRCGRLVCEDHTYFIPWSSEFLDDFLCQECAKAGGVNG